MFEPHLIPELEELLNLVEAKEASRHGPLNTRPPHWNDRGAAFVYLPEVTQRAIVRLLRETTALPLNLAIKDLQRQLDEKDAAIERLRKEPEELGDLLNKRDNQLSASGQEIMKLEVANAKLLRALADFQKKEQKERAQQEANRSKVRKEERAQILEATSGQSPDDRFESVLAAISVYLTALDTSEVKQLGPAKLAEHFKIVRSRLMKIDDEVNTRFARIRRIVKERKSAE